MREDTLRVHNTVNQPRPAQLQPLSVRSSAERKMEVGEKINSVEQSVGAVDVIFRTLPNKATGQKEIMNERDYLQH